MGEAGPVGGSGMELLPLGRKAKFTRAPPAEGSGETPCKGSLWVLRPGDAEKAYYLHRATASLRPDHQELEGGNTERPCSSTAVPKSSYISHFP